jgi:hypothetical protein
MMMMMMMMMQTRLRKRACWAAALDVQSKGVLGVLEGEKPTRALLRARAGTVTRYRPG